MAERTLDRREQLATGRGAPASVPRGLVPSRNRPVGDEAAEVVDARDVDELERPCEALDPPAEAGPPMLGPVVQRVAPMLPVRVQRIGRCAGYLAAREELRPRRDVRALVGDVDRDVADEPHAPVARVVAQRAPLTLEAHLVGERSPARPLP